jgi:hypothetical protein
MSLLGSATLPVVRGLMLSLCLTATATAQVHYHNDGNPWKQRANGGPDAQVDGWYYNLGITGIRVQLLEDQPRHLLVKHVFPDSPASRRVQVGDHIVGAGGTDFETDHQNGYGMDKFGPQGPIFDFAQALEACQEKSKKGRLELSLLRSGKQRDITLKVGTKYGKFS